MKIGCAGGDDVGRAVVLLAAGLGTRMKSKRHKVLHEVLGKPMLLHLLDELDHLACDQRIVVVGQLREQVQALVGDRADIAVQEQQFGTGDAVRAALPVLRTDIDTVVVLYGDAPLIRHETIQALCDAREEAHAAAAVLVAEVRRPTGLGRVVRAADGGVERIVEEKDASPEEKQIRLINTGIYAFRAEDLRRLIPALTPDNAQGEYYLTDVIRLLREAGERVVAVEAEEDEIASVNDRAQLAEVERILRRRICERWMRDGVTIVDPDRTWIGVDVRIGRDTVIWPGTVLQGRTEIGEDCVIGPNARIRDSRVGDGATVEASVVLESDIGSGSSVGPFAYLRPGSRIGERVKIGDFVEVKNSVIGDDTKVSHLAYVGDADIGARTNIACGVITVNYDGERKHRTVVGSDSFIGCNVNLIAPVTVGDGAYVCAGTTVTDDVPEDGFAIGRPRQTTKPNYVRAWKARRRARLAADLGGSGETRE
ncbi:MAG: bifunctional UDP-N-acetylglucosamine diphosphorylase/glucosamine-1-phosphate N-acetyltransferase GlmU [Thermoflavifilum sp.]|nr:bifunctional UDP-N-acetylglucosamine diphosphorylase/glucosamine-1-phosphate N-acetyltransferase GlmU [Thermoflavifilum sp.]MCL6513752.1 bifunctional UDP-N-acetylglucosamine diphosphorylase/glucosamine-1-phosphate N-acetyltransferase GlmU [Alicyclobacillus sp.]